MGCCVVPTARRSRALVWVVLAAASLTPSVHAQAPANDDCPTATPVAPGVTLVGDSSAATADALTNQCAPTSRDVWHMLVAPTSGLYTISLCGSSYNTVLTLFETCGGPLMACDDDSCGQQSQIVWPLTAGQSYRLRVAAFGTDGAGGAYRLTVTASTATAPSNNACGTPVPLPLNTVVNATSRGATGTALSSCGTLDRSDVWFTFSPAVAGQYIVEVCSEAFDTVLSVHPNCFGTASTICSDDDPVPGCGGGGSRLVFSPSPGTPVLLRVAGSGGSFGAFSIVVHSPRPNDLCQNATPVGLGQPFQGVTTPAVGTDGQASCSPSGADVWHTFTPLATATHIFSLCASSFDTVLSVHTGCPGDAGSTILACSDDHCGNRSEVAAPLVFGRTYYVRVAGGGEPAQTGAYTLTVSLPPPVNDSCSTPARLTPGLPLLTTNAGASGTDLSPCGAADTADVWFELVAPETASYEISTCGSFIDTTLSLFDGCGSAPGPCSDNDGPVCAQGGSRLTPSLTAGQRVLVRVAGVSESSGDILLQAHRVPAPNDACAGAATIGLGTPGGGTLSGATPSGSTPCGSPDTPDLWFAFTPESTGYYTFSTCGSTAEADLSVFQSCPSSLPIMCGGREEACGALGGQSVTALLQAGIRYRLRVAAVSAVAAGVFRVSVAPAGPPNNECRDAAPLSLNTPLLATNTGATGADVTPCGDGDAVDVWFAFTPSQTGSYQFHTCAAGGLDATLALFGSCTGPLLACSDNDPVFCGGAPNQARVVARLNAGATYLLRAAGAGGAEGSFTVVATAARPPNDTCATAVGVGEGEFPFDTLAADTEPVFMDSSCGLGFNLLSSDIWFRYSPPGAGTVTVDLCDSNFDTAVAILQAGPACPTGVVSALACNDDFDCDGSPGSPDAGSRVAFRAAAGQTYLVRVGSRFPVGGAGVLRINRVPVACPCDRDGLNGVQIVDLFLFLADWFAGNGDFNGSGATDVIDIFDYISCFVSRTGGCG